jgi:hypothetical protein
MGSTCSRIRPPKIRDKQEHHVAPPPYEPKPRTFESSDQVYKAAPELSAHPAFRDLVHDATSTTQLRDATADLLSSTPASCLDQVRIPSHALLRSEMLVTGGNLQQIPVLQTQNTNITAATTPLWRWTNSQCQTWIAAVLVEYAGKSSEAAGELASEFKGWGPNLYMKEWKQWNSWLGQDGQAIFALLMEVHGQEGAVPVTVEIAHYAMEGRKMVGARSLKREKRGKHESQIGSHE